MTANEENDTNHAKDFSDGNPGKAGVTGGGVLAGAGCLVAISPIPLTFIGCAAMGNPGGCGDAVMLIFFTAPVGILIAFIGLIVGIIGAAAKRPTDDIVAPPSKPDEPKSSS